MKQNGFLSSSNGGISMQNALLSSSHCGKPVPKHRGRKSKNDVLKKMELAKKEQVDRFTKMAAPSGLVNGLIPGIINHVRNRKQVHSMIEALVKSENFEHLHSESKQASHEKSGIEVGDGNMDFSGLHRLGCYHEDGPPNATSMSRKARFYLAPMHKPYSSISEGRGGDGDSSMVDPVSEHDALALKLPSSKASENASTLSNEESANFISASSFL
ncbi:uncharacterized protein LOC111295660 [Durio zibethinus]|uniref:Uncharacterized protein LOC111295660 n=1 Tax=Durio zibethinus TaxID=66656 RepID=A0A6P5YXI9_DURZI|nr:uncharacterized protein LOC111295660 [Durio zibethinus]